MSRTNFVLDQVGSVEIVAKTGWRWRGVIVEMQIYVAEEENWCSVDGLRLNEARKTVEESDVANVEPGR